MRRGLSSLLHLFREFDMFWEPINFKFGGGKTKFKSYAGAVASVIMLSLVFYFAAVRMVTMATFVDAKVKTEVVYDHFND